MGTKCRRFYGPPRNLRAKTPRPFWISGKAARQLVHQWRSEEQGILVGTRTALEDNPRLNTRLWSGSSPLRILIDRELKVPRNYHIYNTEANTLIFCNVAYQPETTANLRFHGLTGQKPLLLEVLEGLWKEQVQSVLVEGGARTLNGFLEKGIWDEARILEGPNTMGNGLEAPQVEGTLVDHWKLEKDQISIVRNDT
jgi:diaminohydroxyphosphoribosylaminopyrimidine deaminase/5-amino-6-(5-phosphoribosylamino)uracil reductase